MTAAAALMKNDKETIRGRPIRWWGAAIAAVLPGVACAAGTPDSLTTPWWIWPLALLLVCFVLGMIAGPAGIGGGVLFVPIVSGFFPFHLDFVRGAGLLVALASALAAGPGLLRAGLADLRLALPLTLLASAGAIVGALVGLALPAALVETGLGVTILCIAVLMWRAKRSEYPEVARPDALGAALRICGVFHDAAAGRTVAWRVHRTPLAVVLFAGIGVLAGVFGLGAGWANVPVLNLVMGVPLKVSAGTSGFILSIADSAAAWVYISKGALLAIVAVPSVIGMMLGAFIGARLLGVMNASAIRRLVIGLLLLAGARALAQGMGWWA
jgi:uncharacterized membrane protein YfcA